MVAFLLPSPPRTHSTRRVQYGIAVLALTSVASGQEGAPTPAPLAAPAQATSGVDPQAASAVAADVAAAPRPLVISTDRPSFSDSTGITPLGHLQLETGVLYTDRDRDEVQTQRVNGPEMLARFAVLEDRLELRAIWAGYAWTESRSNGSTTSDDGFTDVALGFKLKLWDQDGLLPRVALVAATTLGTGSGDVSTQEIEPIAKLAWSYDLGNSMTLGGNGNIAWPTNDGSHFVQGQWSIYWSFSPIERTSLFVEYFGIGPNTEGSGAANYVDFGGTYLLNDRVQLDARVGFGLSDDADNVFAGIGMSFLF